ncbi:hypothetical protein E4V99_14590 [Microbacterium sp. dk485]|uniref:hypothetical protein n=1 Tax=Microbacterium sp. dk485 TaxID=2560021 RepID=UPI0010743901|nr:hypothetical protein [Microbacterium sp. dk485]TFV82143.1 hypothetical protein E4V99_14590 [Microbacterium sp. dk485]
MGMAELDAEDLRAIHGVLAGVSALALAGSLEENSVRVLSRMLRRGSAPSDDGTDSIAFVHREIEALALRLGALIE